MKTKIGRNELCSCGSGKKYKKCCMNQKQSSNTNSIRLPKRNTDTIYSVVLTGMNVGTGVGFNLPEFQGSYENELSKGNVWESTVLLDLDNRGVNTPSIVNIVHSGFPQENTTQGLIMKSLGEIIKYSPLPFLTSDTRITVSMVKSGCVGVNIYSEYDEYMEYVKTTHEDLTKSFYGIFKNVG